MNINIKLILLILTLSITSLCNAQFGNFNVPKVPGLNTSTQENSSTQKGGSGETMSASDFGHAVTQATHNSIAARLTFLDAQAKLMQALGLKTDAVVKASEALRATEGASSDAGEQVNALKDSINVSSDADKQVARAMNESQNLSEDSRRLFSQGAAKFVQGVILERNQIIGIKKLGDEGKAVVSNSDILTKAKALKYLKPTLTLIEILPSNVVEGISTLGKLMSFAKSQNISDIPDADKATASVGEL